MKTLKLYSGTFSLFLMLLACSKKESKDAAVPTGTVQVSMRLATGVESSSFLADPKPSDFKSNAIISGSPDEMKISIKKMILSNDTGTQITIFSDDSGKELSVKSGKLDISSLFTKYACLDKKGSPVEGVECPCGLDDLDKPVEKDAEGKCKLPESYTPPSGLLEAQEGTFTSLRVEFGIAAKMKGCLTGNYSTNGGQAVQGLHTYCTNSAKSTFQPVQGGTNADFEIAETESTEMDVQLSGLTPMPTTKEMTVGKSFPIKGGVTITANQKSDLSLVIDTNRMLRFYNQNTPDQAPNPGMPLKTSYFFTGLVFDNSVFVFVGKPGEIMGFQTWTDACYAKPKPADRICADTTLSRTVVAGWVTVIKDSEGKPMVMALNPDDDNTTTLIKGSNVSQAGIDTAAFVSSGSNFDMKYSLSNDGGGTLYGINLESDLLSTQTATFECKMQSNDYYGKVFLRRYL